MIICFAEIAGLWISDAGAWIATAAALGAIVFAVVRYVRRHRFVEYGVRMKHFDLAKDGPIDYAEWDHRKTRKRQFQITQADVDYYRQFVSEGDFAIDIGAYCGDKTVPIALAAGATGCVLALEPNPHVFKALAKNVMLNPSKIHLVARNVAATREEGEFTFHYSDASFCNGGYLSQIQNRKHGHRHELKVTGVNLQRLLYREFSDRLPRLSLIKIDAEGHDREILRSIADILRAYRPFIICEVYKHLTRSERDQLFDTLSEAGYDLFDDKRTDGPRLVRDDLYQDRNLNVLARPNSVATARAAA